MSRRLAALVIAAALMAAGCSSTNDASQQSGSITVAAATSLTNAFNAITSAFEAANPGTSVTMSFGASSTLATNINDGAPIDVFAAADAKNIDKVASKLSGSAEVFTTNRLAIMVQPGNPKGVKGLADLARGDVSVATCNTDVPIRTYTDQALATAGVTANFVTFEANVGGIVTKITSGAVDAGVVYRTDVIAAGANAEGVDIPTAQNVVAEYPIGLIGSTSNERTARAFIEFVRSAEGQKILSSFGFGEG
ncbi:MAG: molybdate transporter substrate-binding protein [Actinomycetota bacterium]